MLNTRDTTYSQQNVISLHTVESVHWN